MSNIIQMEKEYKYHFGVSNELIWITHILMGLFFIYIGYAIITRIKIPIYLALIVVVLGALGGLYHTHLWYEHISEKKI